jgi:hypothetical protein
MDQTSKAVIANGKDHGCVLYYLGRSIAAEIEDAGLSELSDLGLDDAPRGISIWEGVYVFTPGSFEYPAEGDSNPSGSFRPPTDDEWTAIRQGHCPWDDMSIDLEQSSEIAIPLCERCNHKATSHSVDDEERRECMEFMCACEQFRGI